MIETIIRLSVHNKLVVGLLVLGLIGLGIYNLSKLPLDAVPDITNNQVQVVTTSPSLAPQEVEQFITYPIEVAMANIPRVNEIRSISRYGLSVVTIVFEDQVPVLDARQFVKEQIGVAEDEIPAHLGVPELMPITTGLGEIYQYVLNVKQGYEHEYDAMKLRTIQDWIVKRQLAGISGIIEISSFGGFLKQYEIALDPHLMRSLNISITEVFEALSRNNQNSGGSYIEKATNAYYIRTEGLVQNEVDIENIVIGSHGAIPILLKDLGKVKLGSAPRFGAMTMDGKGEAVGGITLMLKGANSSEAISNVHERVEEVKRSLPEGVDLVPYLDRSTFVSKTTSTVKKNLIEGGLIVIVVLLLLLGNFRAGLIVASIIPLSMLVGVILMNQFGVTANLMSLGAIDFGIVVDGAVIIVEGVMFGLATSYAGKSLSQHEMDEKIIQSSSKLFRSAVFGVFIILVVFIPIMTLTGIEGKMFRPMAMTFSFIVFGSLILSLTYLPMISALVLSKNLGEHKNFSDRIMDFCKQLYKPILKVSLHQPFMVLLISFGLFAATYLLFQTLGAVFVPTLEEGDLAMQMTIQPGSSLKESVRTSTKAEKIILANFPEVKHVVSKIGTAEVPTDPMAIEDADIMIILKEKEDWVSASTREGLVDKMKEKLEVVIGASFEFTQPIQLRFNELMTGAKTDIAVKIFGENTNVLKELADQSAILIEPIPGAADIKVEATQGLSQLMIQFDRKKIAQYGLNIEDLNTIVRMAYAGESAGVVFENERKFDLVVRFDEYFRGNLDLAHLYTHTEAHKSIPLSEVAQVRYEEGPMQVSREDARRYISIGINVRNRDVASLVADIQDVLDNQLVLPPGYTLKYGGEFENLQAAQKRLSVAVPVALLLIFALLFFTFEKIKYALMIFTAVPLSAIGGVLALWIRGMPFSISAGVGFIALFGVAVLNGIVLISHFNRLRYEQGLTDIKKVVIQGSLDRMRSVIIAAAVAALGFLPMALSTSNGAEVQKPLATVVIGGLITATLLTLLVLPILYYLVNKNIAAPKLNGKLLMVGWLFVIPIFGIAQPSLTLDSALLNARKNHPQLKNATLLIQQSQMDIISSREVQPTEFEVTGGQVNSNLFDYDFSVRQELGNPGTNKQRKMVAEAKKTVSEKEFVLIEHNLVSEITILWYDWVQWYKKMELLQEQRDLYSQLLEKATIQFETGEISKVDITLVENGLIRTESALADAQGSVNLAFNILKKRAYLSGAFLPPDGLIAPLPFPDTSAMVDLFLPPSIAQIQVAQEQMLLQKRMLQPKFSIGYFNQSIRPDFSFQGASVGVAVPFWKKGNEARTEKARLELEIAKNRLDQQSFEWQQERNMQAEYTLILLSELENNGRRLLSKSDDIRSLARSQWENGEIDYFRYLQNMEIALSNEMDHFQLLKKYNRAVLRLQYILGQ